MNKEKKKNKRGKRRLLLYLMLLLFTGLLLGTSTYAWFTANKNVSVNDITVNVAAQNGIQISVDGSNWKSIVQTNDLLGATTTYSAAVNQIPESSVSIAPVSTVMNVDANGRLEMFLGDIKTDSGTGKYITTAVKENESHGNTGSFIAFDLFFKVDDTTPVWILPGSGVSASGNDTGIKNASRFGFVILGNTSNGSTLSTIQALNAGTSSQTYLWEPNYDVHSASGVNYARDTYNITTTQTNGSLLPYSGVKAAIAEDDLVYTAVTGTNTHATLYDDFFDAVTPDYTTVAGFDEALPVWTFSPGITKVRVYMWIEGQDVDCENGASGGNITYSFQMTSEDPNA